MSSHDPNRLPGNNPYTPPVAESLAVEPIDQLSQAESVRHNHIGHEKSIQAFGLLFFLGGVILILLSTFLVLQLLLFLVLQMLLLLLLLLLCLRMKLPLKC